MRQSGHWGSDNPIDAQTFYQLLHDAIAKLNVTQAVTPFINDPQIAGTQFAPRLNAWNQSFWN
jgi:hypothetical protein